MSFTADFTFTGIECEQVHAGFETIEADALSVYPWLTERTSEWMVLPVRSARLMAIFMLSLL
jgi:hypothetical protein